MSRPVVFAGALPIAHRCRGIRYPVVTITGPRQSGKTTPARHTFETYTYVSLELPDERTFAQNRAMPQAYES